MVEKMDAAVGKVLSRLDDLGIGEWGKVEEEEWEIRCMEVYAAMVDERRGRCI